MEIFPNLVMKKLKVTFGSREPAFKKLRLPQKSLSELEIFTEVTSNICDYGKIMENPQHAR